MVMPAVGTAGWTAPVERVEWLYRQPPLPPIERGGLGGRMMTRQHQGRGQI